MFNLLSSRGCAKRVSIKRHYEIHAGKYDKYTGQLRTEKVNNLALALKKSNQCLHKEQ